MSFAAFLTDLPDSQRRALLGKPLTQIEPKESAVAPPSASVTPITTIHSYNLHEPFLERAAAKESATSANIGLGAFVTLRLADHFSEDEWEDQGGHNVERRNGRDERWII